MSGSSPTQSDGNFRGYMMSVCKPTGAEFLPWFSEACYVSLVLEALGPCVQTKKKTSHTLHICHKCSFKKSHPVIVLLYNFK